MKSLLPRRIVLATAPEHRSLRAQLRARAPASDNRAQMTANQHQPAPPSPPLPPPPPTVLGIVGGIGAGKTHASRRFAQQGVPVFDADANAKSHLDDPDVRDHLARAFGEGVLGAEGRVDRAALAGIVFADREKLSELEAILHPLVIRDQHAFIDRARDEGAAVVLIDAPLLLEAGFDRFCHAVVFVDAPRATRLGRVLGPRGWSESQFLAREKAQWPVERKKSRADFVLKNTDECPSLDAQIRQLLATL